MRLHGQVHFRGEAALPQEIPVPTLTSPRNNFNITRLIRSASNAYLHNHLTDIFGPSYAISRISQCTNAGYVRSDEDMDKIAQYGLNRMKNAKDLGLIPLLNTPEQKEQNI